MERIQMPDCQNERVPKPEAPFHHILPIQVRFTDIDVFGHINNGAYFSFFDLGKSSYLTSVTDSKVATGGIAAVIVNTNANFYSQGYFDEPLAVATSVVSISERSFVMDQRVFNIETGDVKCAARSIMAGFDPTTSKGAPIPDSYTSKMEAFEERELKRVKS